uniref:Biogenesis of lysosome-related organelles complex 1 subunit 5 n=1 Tax=Oryzias latipes TaxID=8090 RepID=A0A3P9K3Z9_ORYLA
MDKIAKDVGDIKSRLLDHRPVINAETRFFVREFEVTEAAGSSSLDSCTRDSFIHLYLDICVLLSLKLLLEAANHVAERVQQRELEAQKLQANMEKLKEDWSEFLKEQQVLKEEVDEEHAKAVGELGTRFSEKKKDLAQYSFI